MMTFAYVDLDSKRVSGWFTADDNYDPANAPAVAGSTCVRWTSSVPIETVNQTHYVELVVANGVASVDLVEYTSEQAQRKAARPSYSAEWSNAAMQWIDVRGLAQAKVDGQSEVDAAAGRARLRYITDVPGQQATYTRKEQQAREWVNSGYSGPAPSFIAAEAAALGETPQHIAQQVITLADYWAYVKGPEIEAARIKHKAAVRAAATLEAVQTALNDAINELEAL